MFDCHKARCITEAATNSCHITHKQMDSSKETFCGLKYSMISFSRPNSLMSKTFLKEQHCTGEHCLKAGAQKIIT